MKQTLRSHKVRLTTLSPLFIGAGEEHTLSPYSDYVQRGDSLIYIDTDKLQEAMQGNKALVDAFVNGIRQFDNNRSTFELETFITETLGRKVDDFAARQVRIEGDINKAHLRRFVATAGKPFIPGSSLKGAIRTATLVDWLLNRKDGEPELGRIRSAVKEGNQNALETMNPERACFGSIKSDVFRHLRISDSAPIEGSHLMVGEMKRVALPSEKKKQQQQSHIPQWSEMIDHSVETTFSISMTVPAEQTKFPFLDHQSVPELFSIVNQVSFESCQRELDELEGFGKFHNFIGFYEDLEQSIESLKPNEAIIRLGGGKTWHDNSIGLSIDNNEFGPELLFKQYLQLLMGIKNIPFPSTRSAIVKNNIPIDPLGWVKLTLLRN